MELASAPESDLRDGQRAAQICRRILEQHPDDFQTMEVLAAALAETGDFSGAIEMAQRAVQVSQTRGVPGAPEQIRKALDLYARGQPLRQP